MCFRGHGGWYYRDCGLIDGHEGPHHFVTDYRIVLDEPD
jgi:hypothetical protein